MSWWVLLMLGWAALLALGLAFGYAAGRADESSRRADARARRPAPHSEPIAAVSRLARADRRFRRGRRAVLVAAGRVRGADAVARATRARTRRRSWRRASP